MTLKVIKPITFTPEMLVSTTATEVHPDWAVGTTYATGAKVNNGGRLYESLANANTGNPPATSPTKWLDIGPDNRRAMFDDQISTSTTAAGSLTVVVKPGNSLSVAPHMFDSIALVNLVGSSLRMQVVNDVTGDTIIDQTYPLDASVVTDWYQYFFQPFDQRESVSVTDVPPYSNAKVTLTLTGAQVGIGNLVLGTGYSLGEVLHGLSLGTDDYSVVTTDEFGQTTLKRRNSSKRANLQVILPRAQLRKAFAVLDDMRATPAVWIPSVRDDDTPLTVYGIRSSFHIAVEYPSHVLIDLELKGMI